MFEAKTTTGLHQDNSIIFLRILITKNNGFSLWITANGNPYLINLPAFQIYSEENGFCTSSFKTLLHKGIR